MSIQQTHNDATNLRLRLLSAKTHIETLEPLQQVQELHKLSADAELLKSLQQKVNATFLRSQGAIQDANESDLFALLDVLGECDDFITKIQTHSDMALEVLDLAGSVQTAFQEKSRGSLNQNTVKSLQERVTLMAQKPSLCQGNLLAVQSLQANIQQLLQPVQTTVQQSPSNLSSSINTSSMQSNRQIQVEINENYEVTLFADQGKDLITELTTDPVKNFEMALEFYKTVKAYKLQKNTFVLPENEQAVKMVLFSMESVMELAIGMQKDIEQEMSTSSSLQGLSIYSSHSAQGNSPAALEGLKEAIEAAIWSMNGSNHDPIISNKNIQEAFSKLSQEDKEKLFQKVSDLLLEGKVTKRPLPVALQGQPFSIWTNSLEYKLKAVTAILDSQNSSSRVASPALIGLKNELTSALEKFKDKNADALAIQKSVQSAFLLLDESEKLAFLNSVSAKLIERKSRQLNLPASFLKQPLSIWPGSYEDKLNALLAILPSSSSQAQPVIVITKKSEEMQKRMVEATSMITQITINSSNTITNSNMGNMVIDSTIMNDIEELQALLQYLQETGSYRDLQMALEGLMFIESKSQKCTFKISGNVPSLIADRPCFHLYFIHKNESPQNLVNDDRYGNNAMCGVLPALNSERKRAIERTIVEMALEGLENAMIFEKNEEIKAMIEILDGFELSAKDQLNEDKNIANVLFGTIYKLQCDAFSTDRHLANPHSNSEFGRDAFCMSNTQVNLETKIAAVTAIRESLKTVWKLT